MCCLGRHVDGSTLRFAGLTVCTIVQTGTVALTVLTGTVAPTVLTGTVALGADGDDEGLLLVVVEKKVERCKAAELFTVGRESTGLKNLFLWDCYSYRLLSPDLTNCLSGDSW